MVKLCLDKEIEINQIFFGIDSKKYIDILTKKPLEQDKNYKIIIDDKEYNLDSLIQFKVNIKDFGAIYLEFEQFSDDKERDELLNKIKSLSEKDNYLDKVSGCLEIAKEKALFILINPSDEISFNLKEEDISVITILLKEKKEIVEEIDITNKDDIASNEIKEVIKEEEIVKNNEDIFFIPIDEGEQEAEIIKDDKVTSKNKKENKVAKFFKNTFLVKYFKTNKFDLISSTIFAIIVPYLGILSVASFKQNNITLAIFTLIFSILFIVVTIHNEYLIFKNKNDKKVALLLLIFVVIFSIVGAVVSLLFVNAFIKVDIDQMMTWFVVGFVLLTIFINIGGYFLVNKLLIPFFKNKKLKKNK